VFQWQVQPTLDVQFNINVEKVADDVHEVALKIDVSARSENGVHFVVDLSYAGLFGIRNAPEEALPPFLLVEAPRLIFPFARQVIAEAVSSAGFPPLLLDPIDFTGAYLAQLQAAQGGEAGDGGSGAETPSETPSEA
jgi:preprotein translocase subunit SecB